MLKKIAKNGFRYVMGSFAVIALYVAGILGYGMATDFKPTEKIELAPMGQANLKVIEDSSLNLLIWNIGYAGLGKESDFFFDNGHLFLSHGKMVYAPEPLVRKNMAGIESLILEQSVDFLMLQEIDIDSRRSSRIDQYSQFGELLPTHTSAIAINYQSDRVPIPIFEPWHHYGHTKSGVATYSAYAPKKSTRYQLPGEFPLPMRLFQLDRCALVQRFQTNRGKELVLFNIHNSAHDRDGALKKEEMRFLKKMLLSEYAAGHYVIAGGDWNQCPPDFIFDAFMPGQTQGYSQLNIEADFMPADWVWAYDAAVPSNRKCKNSYKQGETFVTIIDFFLCSPNVQVDAVNTVDLNFEYSDHQPVKMKISLLP